MIRFLQNFLVAIFVVGFYTRILLYILKKRFSKKVAMALSPVIVGFTLFPLLVYVVGWDIIIAEYLLSLLVWIIFDLLRESKNQKKEKK